MKKFFITIVIGIIFVSNVVTADEDQRPQKPWTIKKAPDELSERTNGWEDMLDTCIYDFFNARENAEELYEANNYKCTMENFRILYKVSRGILIDNTDDEIDFLDWVEEDKKTDDKSYKKFISSFRLLSILYEWVMPPVKQTFQLLDKRDQIEYMDILNHTIRYTNKYNHERELNYLTWLQYRAKAKNDPSIENLFIERNPSNIISPYRKIEAFVFRRVQEGMKIEHIRRLLAKLNRDLQPLVKEDKKKLTEREKEMECNSHCMPGSECFRQCMLH